MRTMLFATAAVMLLAACAEPPTTPAIIESDEGPSYAAIQSSVVPGRFIVTLREGVSAADVAREHGVAPDFVYSRVLNGFAGTIADAAREGLLRDARVARVEPDGIAHAWS